MYKKLPPIWREHQSKLNTFGRLLVQRNLNVVWPKGMLASSRDATEQRRVLLELLGTFGTQSNRCFDVGVQPWPPNL